MATEPSISVWTSLVVMSAVLLTTYAGPMCYDCKRIPYPRDCGHVRQCGDGEICETRLFVSDSGHRYFDTGCQSKDRCLSTRDVSAVTYDEMDDEKGDLTVCKECCHEDFCNTHGCGSQPLPELSARGPICFNCNQQQSPDSCEMVTVCSHGEVCSLLRYHSSTDDILYTSSCKYESICTALQGVVQPAIVGRRSVTGLCMGCCNTDHCNRNCTVDTNIHPSQPETTSSIPFPTHAMTPSTTYVTTPSNAHTTTQSTAHVTTEANSHTTKPSTANVTTESNAHTTKPSTAHVTTQSNAPTTTPSTTYVVTQSTTTLAPEVLNKMHCESMGYVFLSAFHVCYRVYSNTMLSWQKSREYCKNDGGDLIVFHSIAEEASFDVLVKMLSLTDLIHIRYWVGASDIQSETNWIWLDGIPVDRKYFHPTEPNNAFSGEDCGAMTWYWTDNRVVLNDDNCENPSHFICEISLDHVKEETSMYCRNDDYTYSSETGLCYNMYNNIIKTRDDARRICQSQNADLLILRNAIVEKYFQDLHFLDNGINHRYWLGGDRVGNDLFMWRNGQILDTNLQWTPHEPNNYDGHENCMSFYYNYNTFGLNDETCSTLNYIICEEKCPDTSYHYVPAFGLCFKKYEANVTWSQARQRCRSENTDLLEINSHEELAAVQAYMNSTTHAATYWIGADDPDHDGTFNWLTSRDKIPAELWHPGEPSIQDANEHCAGLWLFHTDHVLKMNDANCDTSHIGFICEYMW